MWEASGSQGDPHLALAHGARADFRGRHGAIFNFLSAQKLSLNVRTNNASFHLREPPDYNQISVDGTFLTEVYVVGLTSKGRFLNLTFGIGRDSRLLNLRRRRFRHRRLAEHPSAEQPPGREHPGMEDTLRALQASCATVDAQAPEQLHFREKLWPSSSKVDDLLPTLRGECDELKVVVTEVRRYGGKVSVHVPTMVLEAPGWKITVENKPVYNWISGASRRFDLRIELLTSEADLPTMPHGLIGQSWDGDGRAADGRLDVYPKTAGAHMTTSAMAEGAIEGIPAHYEVATPYDVRFLYSRFGTQHVPARNTKGLNVSKVVSMLSSPSVAGASDERAQ